MEKPAKGDEVIPDRTLADRVRILDCQRRGWFSVLKLQPGASIDEVKHSFQKLALLHHPDKLPAEANYTEGQKRVHIFSILVGAYEEGLRNASAAAWRLLTGSDDGTVRVWDAGRMSRCFAADPEGPSASIESLSVFKTEYSELALASCRDKTARIWDLSLGVLRARLIEDVGYDLKLASFSPGGDRALSVSKVDAKDTHIVRIWDVERCCCVATLPGHQERIFAAAFLPDGQSIVTASGDKTAKLWDLGSNDCVRTLKDRSRLKAAAVAPSGDWIVTGGEDGAVKIWDLASERVRNTLEGHSACVHCAAISPDGRLIVTGSHDCLTRVWASEPMRGGSLLRNLEKRRFVNTVSFSEDSKLIAAGYIDSCVRVFDAKTGKVDIQFPGGHTANVRSVCFM